MNFSFFSSCVFFSGVQSEAFSVFNTYFRSVWRYANLRNTAVITNDQRQTPVDLAAPLRRQQQAPNSRRQQLQTKPSKGFVSQ